MENPEFNTLAFNNFLTRLLNDYQKKEFTPENKAAIQTLNTVYVEFNRLVKQSIQEIEPDELEK